MPYKKITYPIILIFIIFLIFQFAIGIIPWQIAVFHHDYPGPKMLTNIKEPHKRPDWLLIHGVNMDAREWKSTLDKRQDIPMIALSLAHHEDGPQFANPNSEAAIGLNEYLKLHKPRLGVIGQSTAALWIADAYARCPSCWKGLKIILLAPNSGTNLQSSFQLSPHFISMLEIIIPNPYWGFTVITACKGVNDAYYVSCKENYLAGRLFRFASIPYYQKLFTYMNETNKAGIFENFMRVNHNDIRFYIAENDRVLNPESMVQIAQKFSIPYQVIPQTSHHGIAMRDDIWLPK